MKEVLAVSVFLIDNFSKFVIFEQRNLMLVCDIFKYNGIVFFIQVVLFLAVCELVISISLYEKYTINES